MRQVFLVAGDVVAVTVPLVLLMTLSSFLTMTSVPTVATAAIVPTWIVVLHLYGLYPRFPRFVTTSTLNELPHVFHATLVASAVTFVWLNIWGAHDLGTGIIALFFATLALLPVMRTVTRHALTGVVGAERVLLVGTGTTTPTVRRALEARNDIRVVDHVALPAQWVHDKQGDDTLPELERLVVEELVDRVLLATRELGDTAVGDFMHWSRRANVSLTVLPEHFDVVGVAASIDTVQGATVVSLQPPVLSRTARMLKRAMDLIGAGAGLVVLSPVMLAVALAVRLDSRGPVFFRQDRIGHGGRAFGLLKFRTMVPDADAMVEELMAQSSDPNWLQIEHDPRVTRVGGVLRSTSLDELPQLWNVLRGHMSLVGPRPHALAARAADLLYWDVDARYRERHVIKPGMTGLAQIRGFRGNTVALADLTDRLQADLDYVGDWSLRRDVAIMLGTLKVMLHPNAY